MKSTLFILSVAAFCTFSPLAADVCCEQPKVNIQARVREIDLNIFLKHYEAVQAELTKIRVEMVLLESDESRSADERKEAFGKFDRRRAALHGLRAEFLEKMEKLASVEVAN